MCYGVGGLDLVPKISELEQYESTTIADGHVYLSTTTSITELPGTAQKGGDDLADHGKILS